MSDDEKYMVWVDIETTGLSPQTDAIVELGIMITTTDLAPVEHRSWIIETNPRLLDTMDPKVREIHQQSGLLTSLLVGNVDGNLTQVELEAWGFLQSRNVENLPICGSSVHFDRAFLKQHMPKLESIFHYRNIDVSTMKNLWELYWSKRNWSDKPPVPMKRYRVIDDINDSIKELHYYLTKLGAL
jgi:oligoribonuclease